MRVSYDIPENTKEDVSIAMRKEKNAVVRERLLAVSMFLDGVAKKDIKKLTLATIFTLISNTPDKSKASFADI